jgi:hypothetical protein
MRVSERTRALKIGAILLALVAAGLVIGFLTLRGDDASPPAASSQTTSPTPTPTDPPVQVEQAYLHAWDVWAEALMTLDPSRLPEVLTGDALELVRGQVKAQRDKNQPVRVRVEHDYRIVLVDAATASVDDRYVNHNVRLDPETLEPIEEDPNEQVRRSFTLRLVDGTWKIAEIIGYES